ncbi:MAG TPA: HAMP domain-containing sensor histidine kinase [Pedobacter sp.]|jgi:two-component system phosphate regulon sensor histidine kinase PhoR
MKKKSISLIIGLMSIALLGVMAMQLYFLKQSYTLKSQLFDQSVNESLNKVAAKVEKYEVYDILKKRNHHTNFQRKDASQRVPSVVVENSVKDEPLDLERLIKQKRAALLAREQKRADSLFNIRDSIFRSRHEIIAFKEMSAYEPEPELYDVKIDVAEYDDGFGGIHRQEITSFSPKSKIFSPERKDSIIRYIYYDPARGEQVRTLQKVKIRKLSRSALLELQQVKVSQQKRVAKIQDSIRSEKKKAVFEDLETELNEVNVPLKKRINPLYLDSMLRAEFQNAGINSYYAYQVASARKFGALIFRNASMAVDFEPENTYRTVLFPNDMIRDAGMLMVTFPNKNSVILSNMGFMMGSSAALLLIVLFCFGFTIHLIIRQKKISEMKTDFINNMTHEFKTPVATIMIASEALKDPEITEDKSRITRLAGIIYDENVRLGNHIERVLNIAKIDKGDLKLDFKPVDMNELIFAVCDSMQLQFQKKEAIVNLHLDAAKATVNGDELHLSNVIYNLVDNALKYSKDNPEISITTLTSGRNLIIRVADKGIGINKDHLSRIFDQFYRIPTGNLHDVKGFGLGLSYVNNIIRRHDGIIKAKSEKEHGSEFEITIPYN